MSKVFNCFPFFDGFLKVYYAEVFYKKMFGILAGAVFLLHQYYSE